MRFKCIFKMPFTLFKDCGELIVPHGSLNGTSTTCGTTRVLTCEPCYNMEGNGLAVCGSDGNWTFESECVIKSKTQM